MKKLLLLFAFICLYSGLQAQSGLKVGFEVQRTSIWRDSLFWVIDIRIPDIEGSTLFASFKRNSESPLFKKGAKGKGILKKGSRGHSLEIHSIGRKKFTRPKTVQLKVKDKK